MHFVNNNSPIGLVTTREPTCRLPFLINAANEVAVSRFKVESACRKIWHYNFACNSGKLQKTATGTLPALGEYISTTFEKEIYHEKSSVLNRCCSRCCCFRWRSVCCSCSCNHYYYNYCSCCYRSEKRSKSSGKESQKEIQKSCKESCSSCCNHYYDNYYSCCSCCEVIHFVTAKKSRIFGCGFFLHFNSYFCQT